MVHAALAMYDEKITEWDELPEEDRNENLLDAAWGAASWLIGWLANQFGEETADEAIQRAAHIYQGL